MNSSSFLEALRSGRVLLGDGAMGTELQKRGLPAGACPEAYNVTRSELIQQIHRDYFAAGSDIVETNTFGGSRSRLAKHGYEGRVQEFSRTAAELARAVCPPGRFVAGSMGPTGELIEPLGPRSEQEIFDIFAEQAAALAAGGVDVIWVETMMAIEEAEVAVRAAKEKTRLPVVATMTFEVGKGGIRTMWGVDIPTAAGRLTEAGAGAIGANCGRGFEEMVAISKTLRPLTALPIVAQANAGIPEWVDGIAVYRETPDAIVPYVEKLLAAGVDILGGCCGTGPAHIQKMREVIDRADHLPLSVPLMHAD